MRLLSLALYGLGANIVHGYMIDPETCGENGPLFIGPAIESAFDMARLAVKVIDKGRARSSNENRLVELLFCEEGQDPATVDLGRARASLSGVRRMSFQNDLVAARTDREVENEVVSVSIRKCIVHG